MVRARVTNFRANPHRNGNLHVTSALICSGRMAAAASSSSPHSLATASGLLLGTTGAAMGVGALVGWLLGSAGLGLLIGAIVGIPLAVLVVYKVYTGAEG
jgi:F0F1-type ATP synthase assembly protein I